MLRERRRLAKYFSNLEDSVDQGPLFRIWETTVATTRDRALDLTIRLYAQMEGVAQANKVFATQMNIPIGLEMAEVEATGRRIARIEVLDMLLKDTNLGPKARARIRNLAMLTEFTPAQAKDAMASLVARLMQSSPNGKTPSHPIKARKKSSSKP